MFTGMKYVVRNVNALVTASRSAKAKQYPIPSSTDVPRPLINDHQTGGVNVLKNIVHLTKLNRERQIGYMSIQNNIYRSHYMYMCLYVKLNFVSNWGKTLSINEMVN